MLPYKYLTPGLLAPGFKNLGNSCFVNSVLQCLVYCPPLAELALSNHHTGTCSAKQLRQACGYCLLERRLSASLTSGLDISQPKAIFQHLQNVFSESFRPGCQEDAHEFFCAVLQAIESSCLRNIKPFHNYPHQEASREPETDVQHIFGGRLQSQLCCPLCKQGNNTYDSFCDLSLDIYDCATLEEALIRFTAPEVLDSANAYKCEHCMQEVLAEKVLTLYQSPPVLVIHLKRFNGAKGLKLNHGVSFDEVLDVGRYLSTNSPEKGGGLTSASATCAASPPLYKLTGVVVHQGTSANSGHYYAYVDAGSPSGEPNWYEMNDEMRSHVSSETVRNDLAYLLFYVRASLHPASNTKLGAHLPLEATSEINKMHRRLDSPMPNTPDADDIGAGSVRCGGKVAAPNAASWAGHSKAAVAPDDNVTMDKSLTVSWKEQSKLGAVQRQREDNSTSRHCQEKCQGSDTANGKPSLKVYSRKRKEPDSRSDAVKHQSASFAEQQCTSGSSAISFRIGGSRSKIHMRHILPAFMDSPQATGNLPTAKGQRAEMSRFQCQSTGARQLAASKEKKNT